MGNCQQFCTPSPPEAEFTAPKIANPYHAQPAYQAQPVYHVEPVPQAGQQKQSFMTGEHVLLRCQICGEDRRDSMLKNHLDICHFAHVVETTASQYQVVCLLCEFKSHSLEQHKNHFNAKHPYMQYKSRQNAQQQINGTRVESNASIKNRVSTVSKLDIYMRPDGRTAQIAGVIFDAYGYQNQYGAMEFNQDIAKGDLVWRYVFQNLQDATFYHIEYVPKQKTIQAVSKIFVKTRGGLPV